MLKNKPIPDGEKRALAANERRHAATAIAAHRGVLETHNNGELAYHDSFAANFTKGLPHNEFGIVTAGAFEKFVNAINAEEEIKFDVPLGPE